MIQDVQLLVSPEYIFGVEPGDIVSLHTLFSAVRGDFFKDVELALKLYTPPLVVVATSVVSEENPIQSVLDMMDKVATGCPRLRRWLEEGSIVMEGCLVDPKSRRTEFISRIPFTHSAEDHNVLSQAVES